jgi:hypothetical protein
MTERYSKIDTGTAHLHAYRKLKNRKTEKPKTENSIFILLRSPGIDLKESTGTTTLFLGS